MDLNDYRIKIDEIDSEIVKLFSERMKISEEIAEYKVSVGIPVFDPIREASKLTSIAGIADAEHAQAAKELYGRIFELSRRAQKSIICKSGILHYKASRSIALIGMPGCGKSSIGKALSEIMGRKICDTDDMITESTGQLPCDIINSRGEPEFRKLETEALKEAVSHENAVIATGGGVVVTLENYALLSNNCLVILLNRRLEDLPVFLRPLSVTKGIYEIFMERGHLYEAWSDITYQNIGITETAQKIAEDYC